MWPESQRWGFQVAGRLNEWATIKLRVCVCGGGLSKNVPSFLLSQPILSPIYFILPLAFS